MKLISLYIENFGRFSDFSYDFKEDLNVFYKENGWGKTTLSVFIKAMLYGLNAVSSKYLEKNDRKKYLPWDNSSCSGNLIIEVNGKQYKIERTFAKSAKDDTCIIYDLQTNKKTSLYDSNIGEQILNISSDSFERSVYIPQKEIEFGFDSDISARLSALIGGVDDTTSFDGAIKSIDEEIKELKKTGNKGLISEQKEHISYLETQIDTCKQKIAGISIIDSKVKLLEEKIKDVNLEKEEVKKTLSTYQEAIVKNEQLKMVEKYVEDIKTSKEKINQYENVITTTFDVEKHKQIKEAIKEKQNIDIVLSNKEMQVDDKYNCFIKNGAIDSETFKDIEAKINEGKKTPAFIIRYYVIPVVLVALMVTCIILMFASKGFEDSKAGAIIIPILALSLIISTRNFNKKDHKKELKEFFNKYGYDNDNHQENLVELKYLNDAYVSMVSMINKEKENKDILLKKKEELDKSINDYFNKFDLQEETIEEKISKIESTYLLLINEKQHLASLEDSKESYIKKHDIKEVKASINVDIKDDFSNKLDIIDNKLNELEKEKTTLLNQKFILSKETEVLDDLERQLIEANEEKERLNYRYKVLTNTKELLTNSQETLLAKYIKPMKDAISKYFKLTLLDKNKQFNINTDFEINIIENGQSKEIAYYSKGYQQLVSLCMRFALIDCLFEKEKPFVLLDDPFINLDDDRLIDCVNLIKEVSKQMQVIYFTCHESRNI